MGKFEDAVDAIDAINAEDPNRAVFAGGEGPKELLYGRRVSHWLDVIAPDAPEALKLAARAQHIRRWDIPRQDYPMGKKGYHMWRTTLYRHHADAAAEILQMTGYDAETIAIVRNLLLKKNLRSDPLMQTLEDAVCLVFLENQFAAFAKEHDADKIVHILKRTWAKMTPVGHAEALKLATKLPPDARALVTRAVAEE